MVEEPRSPACRRLLRADRHVGAWALTRTEIASAVHRKARRGEFDAPGQRAALRRLELLASHWTEVDALAPVRDAADRLLRVHELRAADALQLGAALVLADGRPRRLGFVTADGRLALAAEAENFPVEIPTPESPRARKR